MPTGDTAIIEALARDPAEAEAILTREAPEAQRAGAALRVLCRWYYPARPAEAPDRLLPLLRLLEPFHQTVFLKILLERRLFDGLDAPSGPLVRTVLELDARAVVGAATWIEAAPAARVAEFVDALPDRNLAPVASSVVSVLPDRAGRFPAAAADGRMRAALRTMRWDEAARIDASPALLRDFVNLRWVEDPPAALAALDRIRGDRAALRGVRGLHRLQPLIAEAMVRDDPLAACHPLMPEPALEKIGASAAAALMPEILRVTGAMDERCWMLMSAARREALPYENCVRALARVDAAKAKWVVEGQPRRQRPRLERAVSEEEEAALEFETRLAALGAAPSGSALRAVTEPAEHPITDEPRARRIVAALAPAPDLLLRSLEPLTHLAFAEAPMWTSPDLRGAWFDLRRRSLPG